MRANGRYLSKRIKDGEAPRLREVEQPKRDSEAREARKARLWLKSDWLAKRDKKHGYDIILTCRQRAPAVIKRLLELTQSNHGPTAVKACEIILNRAYGRAPITVNVAHELATDELMTAAEAIIRKRLARAAEQSNTIDVIDATPPSRSEGGMGVRSGSPPKQLPPHTQPQYTEYTPSIPDGADNNTPPRAPGRPKKRDKK